MPFRTIDEEPLREAAKAALRGRLKRIRRALPHEAAQIRSERIHARCLAIIAEKPAREKDAVASYLPMQSEIPTAPLHEVLLARGHTIALPSVEPERDGQLVWRRYAPTMPLARHALGFEMPTPAAPEVNPADIRYAIVPCLAVDERGQRLGWGGGFYDRALPKLNRATSIAIAYDFQLLAELPTTETDYAVDWVVTDSRTIEVRSIR